MRFLQRIESANLGQQVYRASPCLTITWHSGITIAENYFLQTQAELSARALILLDALQVWKSAKELKAELSGWSSYKLQQTLTELTNAGLVHTGAGYYEAEKRVHDEWETWSPWGAGFHFATKDMEYQSGDSTDHFFLQIEEPPPDVFKNTKGVDCIALPHPSHLPVSFDSVLLNRKSVRTFAAEPLHLEDIATILYYSWGQTGWIHSRIFGKLLTKTSPSGGSRHPVEAYLISRQIEGLEPGVYHYSVRDHTLERLSGFPYADALSTAFPGQPWILDAPVIFVMTAVIARSMWKYRFERAYRVLLMDVGHVGQTFHLVATAMGLGPATTAAFHDTSLELLLQIDGVTEPALYVAVLGHSSEGGDTLTESLGTRSPLHQLAE